MKRIYKYLMIALAALSVTSCHDYLTELSPGKTLLTDFYNSTAACVQNATGCYVPLMWERQNTYCSEWFIGDIASDDALKGGGSINDMADAYDFENWKTMWNNSLLLDIYRQNFQGVGRCNMAIKNIEPLEVGSLDEDWTESMKNRCLGEAYFLRAYYYFRLVRIFAGVPLVLDIIEDDTQWGVGRASVDEVFTQILSDLTKAEQLLWLKSKIPAEEMGRATKGAAQAMLMKVNLYMASDYWQSYNLTKSKEACLKDAETYGDLLVASGEYSLCPVYEDNFTIAGENGLESIFEIQYAEVAWGDYGQGFGFTAGSFTQILMRSRSSLIGGGWGFDHPTQNLYDEFEPNDTIRRDVAILDPDTSLIENAAVEYYCGNKMVNNKYGMYREDPTIGGFGKWPLHASRGPLNNRQIRYADALLMLAEVKLGLGYEDKAKDLVNEVRSKRGLGDVGTYTFKVNGVEITSPTTEQCIRHERRVELAMEGHRWFDLVRWYGANGGLKTFMEAYQATETVEAQQHLANFVPNKHEIFPIPEKEILLNPVKMEQNPGY